MLNRRMIWRLCCIAVLILAVLTFTPLVIPPDESAPLFMGLPRTLWAGMAIYLALTVLTFIGARAYRGEDAS